MPRHPFARPWLEPETYGPNPPWVDRAVGEAWQSIERAVGAPLMPVEQASRRRTKKLPELGCGHYGCVLPTGKPGIVAKVTSDPLEAHFVAAALKIGRFPEGIVRYYAIYQLAAEFRGRPVFILWREEAFNVGELSQAEHIETDNYERRAIQQFMRRLGIFKDWAGEFKATFDRADDKPKILRAMRDHESWAYDRVDLDDVEEGIDERWERKPRHLRHRPLDGYRGAQRLAGLLRGCEIIAEQMANEPVGYLVGQTLEFYLEKGLLLADVHLGNIGRVVRAEHGDLVWAITDPGHAVPITQGGDTVTVGVLA